MSEDLVHVRLVAEFTLECGCVVRHAFVQDTVTSMLVPHALDFGGRAVSCWYEHNIHQNQRHECELVSAENPSGLIPRAKKCA